MKPSLLSYIINQVDNLVISLDNVFGWYKIFSNSNHHNVAFCNFGKVFFNIFSKFILSFCELFFKIKWYLFSLLDVNSIIWFLLRIVSFFKFLFFLLWFFFDAIFVLYFLLASFLLKFCLKQMLFVAAGQLIYYFILTLRMGYLFLLDSSNYILNFL